MSNRTIEQQWERPEYEVLCELGFSNGAMQIARLEHKGRCVWKSRATAEKHAAEYSANHGRVAYVSEA